MPDASGLARLHFPIGGLINPNSIVACTGCAWRPVYNTSAWMPTIEQWGVAHPQPAPERP